MTTESFIARKLLYQRGFSVLSLPFALNSGEKVRTADRAEEFVVLNHGSDADSCGGERVFDPNYPGEEADAYRIGQGDVWGKGQSDFHVGSSDYRAVDIEENTTGAD